MVIRTYDNVQNRKRALIHEGHKFFTLKMYQFGDFNGTKRYKRFKKAQKDAIKYINK